MSTDLDNPPEQPTRPDGYPAYYPEAYRPEPARPPSLLRRAGAAIAAAVALIAKFAAKLKLLLVALPKIKLLTTSGSMLLSIGAYTVIWGWQFAIGFVALLFVHEMGHAIQLKREGVPTGWP